MMMPNTTKLMKANRKQQAGVALFIALIALMVMSLAAVALIRSVDTNSQITANLAYKQTATISSSFGVEGLADKLGALPYAEGFADGNGALPEDAKPAGYYASCTQFDAAGDGPCAGGDLTSDAAWNPGTTSALATGVGMTAGVDSYGNQIQFIVERMCSAVGEPTADSCLLDGNAVDNNAKNVINLPIAGGPETKVSVPVYRITVRIDGPKNTVSYVQTYVS